VSLDRASDATRRYYNMSTEAAEIPKLLGRRKNFLLVQNDGDDDTYGGAGAYWQRTSTGSSRSTTTASSASRPRSRARPTASDALASLLARRVFARLDG
jgi:hypothetical protein